MIPAQEIKRLDAISFIASSAMKQLFHSILWTASIPPCCILNPSLGVLAVVGAGGTAKAAMYALNKAKGVKKPILIWNRTTSKAEKLALEFGATVVTSLEVSFSVIRT